MSFMSFLLSRSPACHPRVMPKADQPGLKCNDRLFFIVRVVVFIALSFVMSSSVFASEVAVVDPLDPNAPSYALPKDTPSSPSASAPAPAKAAAAGEVITPQAGAPLTLQRFLSADVKECMRTGNCTLDDIVSTGAAFANLLTELSAAIFFATFVYGGAMYLLSFGDSHRVDTGKSAMTGAAIGMAIVLGAWVLVRTLVRVILSGSA